MNRRTDKFKNDDGVNWKMLMFGVGAILFGWITKPKLKKQKTYHRSNYNFRSWQESWLIITFGVILVVLSFIPDFSWGD